MVKTKHQEKNKIIKEATEVLEAPKEKTPNKEKEYLESLQKLQAEFENFQKRTEKEKDQIRKNANETLISKLLPLLDSFELSIKHNKDKGVQIIYDSLIKTLEEEGLKKINTKIPFDPKFHEAVIQEEGEKKGQILEELQKGYLLNDKLLRASKVKITKKTEK